MTDERDTTDDAQPRIPEHKYLDPVHYAPLPSTDNAKSTAQVSDPDLLKKWAFFARLRDPELAKVIVCFCDNIIGELGKSPYTYNHESRLRIIVAALSSNLGSK